MCSVLSFKCCFYYIFSNSYSWFIYFFSLMELHSPISSTLCPNLWARSSLNLGYNMPPTFKKREKYDSIQFNLNYRVNPKGLQLLIFRMTHFSLFLSLSLSRCVCLSVSLRLCNCRISNDGYVCLALTLMLNPSCVKELDVSNNHPGESAQKLLTSRLEDPHRKVEALQYVLQQYRTIWFHSWFYT